MIIKEPESIFNAYQKEFCYKMPSTRKLFLVTCENTLWLAERFNYSNIRTDTIHKELIKDYLARQKEKSITFTTVRLIGIIEGDIYLLQDYEGIVSISDKPKVQYVSNKSIEYINDVKSYDFSKKVEFILRSTRTGIRDYEIADYIIENNFDIGFK